MKYRAKTPAIVDAIQFTGDVEELNAWLGPNGHVLPEEGTDGWVLYPCDDSPFKVYVGWWLLLDDALDLDMVSDAYFRAEFEEVQE